MPGTPLTLPDGLVGLPKLRHFDLVLPTADCPLGWLQPSEEPRIGFAVVDPFAIRPDYAVEMDDPVAEALELGGKTPLVLALVHLADDPAAMTANLLGPLVINLACGVGAQVVLSKSGYTQREPLLAPAEATAPC